MRCKFRLWRIVLLGVGSCLVSGSSVTAAPATTATAALASIQGVLTAHDGSVIRGAKITANLTVAPKGIGGLGPAVTGLLQGSAVTAADGSFSLTKLLPGTYTFCAQAAQASEIDPCHWGQTPPQVTVSGGQALTGFKISTKQGSIVNVRIDDPKHLLLGAATAQGLPHVLVGVYTGSGQFYSAYVTSKDVTGVNYSLTIPTNTALRLTVSSKHVKLVDSAGTPVPANGLTYAFRHDSSVNNSKPVEVQITGAY